MAYGSGRYKKRGVWFCVEGYFSEGEVWLRLTLLCSEEDSDTGNPLIAADEDLSSPDEPVAAATPTPPTKHTTLSKPLHSPLASSSEEDAPGPVILTPIQAPPPQPPQAKKKQAKAASKPLKSALDVELTESEEEDEEEEDSVDGRTSKKPAHITSRSQLNGKTSNLDDIFEPSPLSERKKVEKSGGLMLQFGSSVASPAAKPPPAPSKEAAAAAAATPTAESPDQRRREKRKKKSKRSKHSSSKEENGEAGGGGITPVSPAVTSGGGGGGGGGAGDPYGVIASLDAWLNSDSTGLVSHTNPLPLPPLSFPVH